MDTKNEPNQSSTKSSPNPGSEGLTITNERNTFGTAYCIVRCAITGKPLITAKPLDIVRRVNQGTAFDAMVEAGQKAFDVLLSKHRALTPSESEAFTLLRAALKLVQEVK